MMSLANSNPFDILREWLQHALKKEKHYNAATLATVTKDNKSNSRIVYVNLNNDNKLLFYTNLESTKSIEIHNNNNISLCIFWPNIEKQIRIIGTAKQLDDHESTIYFNQRSREKQLAAWSSKQSQILTNRSELLSNYSSYETKFMNLPVSKPPFWGGFMVSIEKIEFWKMHPDRLHERDYFEIKDGNFTHYNIYP
jgi:pyridoxamine 5'-phosphate oxidase